jgi:hypothetical protein
MYGTDWEDLNPDWRENLIRVLDARGYVAREFEFF